MMLRAEFDGMANPMPGKPPVFESDHRVDADELAARVDQRAAGIAGIDGCVGLDDVLVGADLAAPTG